MPYADPEKRRANWFKNHEQKLEYQRAQYRKHREKRLAAKREDYWRDPDKLRERNKQQYYANQKARIDYARAYRAERLEQLAVEATKRYYADHEGKKARRRALSKRPEARQKQYAAFQRWARRNPDKVALYYAKSLLAEQTGIPAREIPDDIAAAKVEQLKISRWVREQIAAQADRNPEGEKPQALSAEHESPVAEGDAPNPTP